MLGHLTRIRRAARARKAADQAFKDAVVDAWEANGTALGDLADAAGMTKQGVLALLTREGAREVQHRKKGRKR